MYCNKNAIQNDQQGAGFDILLIDPNKNMLHNQIFGALLHIFDLFEKWSPDGHCTNYFDPLCVTFLESFGYDIPWPEYSIHI